jgi:GT2 family glycosyltransferase
MTRARGVASISVVVPTRDRRAQVSRLVQALAKQEPGVPFDLFVVDDGSTDGTRDQLQLLAPDLPFALHVLSASTGTGPAGARNRGWRASSAPLVAFIDDDCVPEPAWLRAMATGLTEADVVVGRTKPPHNQVDRIGPFSSYIDSDSAPDLAYLSCNIAYRRSVLEQLGGFDEERFPFPNGEDTDLGLRARKAGFRDRSEPDALVWHDVGPSEFMAHLRRVRRLDGIVALVAAHPEARQLLNAGWFLRSVDKAVLVTWVGLLAFLLRPRRGPTRLLAVIGALLYIWQFDRSHYQSRSVTEWLAAIPKGFVADSWALAVLVRSSVRHRTILL